MFVLKRNQVIITALVVMIAIAGYLSWLDSQAEAITVGYQLTDQGDIAALIPDMSALAGLIPDEPIIMSAWPDDHNPAIAVSGDDIDWPTLGGIDLSEIIGLPVNDEHLTEAGEAIFVNTNRDSSFFVQAKLNREQARASEREILNDVINNANIASEQRARAADSMLEIQRRIERETSAEALIESKGFSEVYVRISDNSVDVIVNKETLTEAELAQIMDIIKRKTGMTETQIHISPMRR